MPCPIELVAACAPAGDPRRTARGLPCDRSIEELLARGIDIAVVATPTEDHVEVGLALAAQRIPTLIEPRRSGKHNFYGLTEAGRELAQVVNAVVG